MSDQGYEDDLDQAIAESSVDPLFRGAFDDSETLRGVTTRLVAQRFVTGLSQSEVANLMHTTQSAVSELENGTTEPRVSTLQRYARAVGSCLLLGAEVPSVHRIYGKTHIGSIEQCDRVGFETPGLMSALTKSLGSSGWRIRSAWEIHFDETGKDSNAFLVDDFNKAAG